jgi:hypothetical protein
LFLNQGFLLLSKVSRDVEIQELMDRIKVEMGVAASSLVVFDDGAEFVEDITIEKKEEVVEEVVKVDKE